MKRRVWIVEMLCELPMKKPSWEPTVGIGLDREHGRIKLRQWQSKCNNDRFRLVAYKPMRRAA